MEGFGEQWEYSIGHLHLNSGGLRFVWETGRRQAGLLYKRWSELNAELES